MRTLAIVCFSLCTLPSLAHAEAALAASATEQLVELSWSEGEKDRTRISLALPPDKSCSSVDLERDKRVTQVSVCRSSADGEPAVLQFSVERMDRSGTQLRSLKLRASARLRRGASVVIGRFDPTEGPTELLATLR